jgi:methionyl-tRNA formyltransferase
MDEGLDTGPVLARASVLIRAEDNAGTLADKLSLVSSQLLLDVLPRWAAGNLKPQPQDAAQATLFKTMRKEAGEIDWQLPAVEIWRQVRAFQPWPGAFTRYQGKILKVIEAFPVDEGSTEPPGRVIGQGRGFGVVTGDGVLEVRQLQMEGRQITPAADFLRGQRAFMGTLLPD